jgi:hypothetical protein
MCRARRGWTMPEDDARSMLRLIEERLGSAGIEVRRRDVLVRLREHIEDDLAALEREQAAEAAASASADGARAASIDRP